MRSGFIAVVGAPNVGKSTLVNKLVGRKVSIVSSKPQTTRRRVLGVRTENDAQLIFVDTPGMNGDRATRSVCSLGEWVAREAYHSRTDSDAILLVVDGTHRETLEEVVLRPFAEALRREGRPIWIAVNKIDRLPLRRREEILSHLRWPRSLGATVKLVSAKSGDGVQSLRSDLTSAMPEGPLYFDPSEHSGSPLPIQVSEIIREKLFRALHRELPYSIHVETDRVEQTPTDRVTRVVSTVIVERESQKGIVIGAGGITLRHVGTESRRELERELGRPVFIDLRVIVKRNWTHDPVRLKQLGYT